MSFSSVTIERWSGNVAVSSVLPRSWASTRAEAVDDASPGRLTDSILEGVCVPDVGFD